MGICLVASLFSVSVEAAQINTIVDTGSGMFAEPEKKYFEIDETIKGWFFPSSEEKKKINFYSEACFK